MAAVNSGGLSVCDMLDLQILKERVLSKPTFKVTRSLVFGDKRLRRILAS